MAIDGTDLLATRRELELALSDALARGTTDLAALKLSARLGAVTAEIGNRHEARRHFARVAETGPAVLGADHPLVRQAETYLDEHPRGAPPSRSTVVIEPERPAPPRGVRARLRSSRASGRASSGATASSAASPAAPPPRVAASGPAAGAVADRPGRADRVRLRPAAIDPTGREVERGRSRSLMPLQAPAARGDGAVASPPAGSRRKSLLWAVASSAAIAGVIAASAALWPRDDRNSADAPNAGKSSATPVMAPQHVTATMDHGVVTVKWQDPARGTTPFIVSGGVAGATADVRQQVDAGQSTITINGMNNSRDYCFTVVAVYSADQVAVSDLACTKH